MRRHLHRVKSFARRAWFPLTFHLRRFAVPTNGGDLPPGFGMERPFMWTKRRLLGCAGCKRPTPEIWRWLSRRAEVAASVSQPEVIGGRFHPLRYQMAMLIQWTIDDNPFAEP